MAKQGKGGPPSRHLLIQSPAVSPTEAGLVSYLGNHTNLAAPIAERTVAAGGSPVRYTSAALCVGFLASFLFPALPSIFSCIAY